MSFHLHRQGDDAMTYVYAALGIAVLCFIAGVGAYPDGPEDDFLTEWLSFTAVFCAVVLPLMAITQ